MTYRRFPRTSAEAFKFSTAYVGSISGPYRSRWPRYASWVLLGIVTAVVGAIALLRS